MGCDRYRGAGSAAGFRDPGFRPPVSHAGAGGSRSGSDSGDGGTDELRDRAVSLFRNWQSRERARLNSLVAELEGRITRTLAGISLDNDRFERVTSELFRLKKRWDMNRTAVESTLEEESSEEETQPAVRQFKTRWYALAIGFLGRCATHQDRKALAACEPQGGATSAGVAAARAVSEKGR